jgi:hypothetical protein
VMDLAGKKWTNKEVENYKLLKNSSPYLIHFLDSFENVLSIIELTVCVQF